MAEKLTLISSFERLNNGDSFEGNNWPLHVTLLTWFDVPTDFDGFIAALSELQHRLQPIRIKGGEKALFGPDENIPVRLIGDVNNLRVIQEKILAVVSSFGCHVWNESFVGAGYRPHVTDTTLKTFDKDETALLTTMNLVKGDTEGERVVVGSFDLEK